MPNYTICKGFSKTDEVWYNIYISAKGIEVRIKMKFGLLGETLRHSFSKQIHSVFGSYEYEYYAKSREEAESFIKSGEVSGMNVTIPYKELAYSLCDELTDTAREAGCVNTVTYRDGKVCGDNTDVFGFMYMLDAGKISVRDKKVIVLGSGGTSKTARLALKRLGAGEVVVVSRSGEVNYDNVYERSDTEIIINTTPVGMYPKNGASPIDLSRFPKCEGVADVVYNPLKTKLLLDAEKLGIPHIGGLYMLAAQGFRAAEVFLGEKLSESLIKDAVMSVRRSISNIILVGMPGSGKSTVASLVAEGLSRRLVDTDKEIKKLYGAPAKIITEQGEAAFRDIECRVVADIAKESGLVIATGGGVCEREENRGHLSQNGKVYLIERSLDKLSTEGRPLSVDVAALYERRKDKYLRLADVKIDNNGKAESAAEKIVTDFLE